MTINIEITILIWSNGKGFKIQKKHFRITDFAKNYLNTVSIVIVASLPYGIGW